MSGVTIQLQGFDELKAKLNAASEKIVTEVDAEIGASMKVMELNAKRDAPVDQGILRGEISSFRDQPLRWMLVSGALHSAFIEFGTRTHVQIPPGLESVAAEARGHKGGSLGAKEAIFKWCERHGIEPRARYAIFIKIMTEGIKPHPFFFKQLEAEKPNLLKNIKAVVSG